MGEFIDFIGNNLADFWTYTGFANATAGHLIMILVGLFFIYLAVAKEFEPMLLIPIGFGILVGNIPFNMEAGLQVGIYEQGSVLNILYQGVTSGWYPPLIFLGIGAMTDFSALISNPKLMLIGAAAQFGIFGAYMIALAIGFDPMQAGAIGIIGGLLLHGTGAGYPAPRHASADHKARTSDPHETASCSFSHGESDVPHHRFVIDMLPGTIRSAFAGYAVLRKSVERKWCDPPSGQYSQRPAD